MKNSFKKLPGSIIELKVELEKEEFKKYWDAAFEGELSKVHLKGFRPGQAPKDLASKAVDSEKVFNIAANNAVRFSLDEIVQDNNWTVIDKPEVKVDSEGADFKYEAKLTLFPEVELGDYKKIARKIFDEGKKVIEEIKITSEESEKAFEWLKKSGANLENFKDEEALKKSISEGLLMEKKEYEKEKQRIKILDEIVKEAKMDIPQIMINKTLRSDSGQAKDDEQAHSASRSTQRVSDSMSSGQAKDEEHARNNVANHLVIYKIAQLENLNPTPEEMGEELNKLSANQKKGVDNQKLYDYIYGVIQNKKVFEFLEGK